MARQVGFVLVALATRTLEHPDVIARPVHVRHVVLHVEAVFEGLDADRTQELHLALDTHWRHLRPVDQPAYVQLWRQIGCLVLKKKRF